MIDSELIREARFLRITVETALVEDACELAKEEDLRLGDNKVKLARIKYRGKGRYIDEILV